MHNQHAPIPYDQLSEASSSSHVRYTPPAGSRAGHVAGAPAVSRAAGHGAVTGSRTPPLPGSAAQQPFAYVLPSNGHKSLPRRCANPFKSFALGAAGAQPLVPVNGQISAPGTPTPRPHLGTLRMEVRARSWSRTCGSTSSSFSHFVPVIPLTKL